MYVYILASKTNGTLYIGVTSNLVQRLAEHRSGDQKHAFTFQYAVHRLVYLEEYKNPHEAILREKQLKKWNRSGSSS